MRDTVELTSTLEEKYRAASVGSRTYFERAQSVMPGGVKGAYYYRPYPLSMERAEGCYLYDVDGRRYIDFNNHHTSQILGHNHAVIFSAVEAQLRQGIALGAPMGTEVEFAEEMCRRVPSLDRIRFCNSGTEATLHAIRLARAFTGRPKIAKFEGAYHGSHDAVEISVSPPLHKAGRRSAPSPVPSAGGIAPHAVDEIVILPYNDKAAVERLIVEHRNELACVLFDPKPHAIPHRAKFVRFLEEILRKNNIIFILDEIVSFRLAPGGFQELGGISPDLTTYGKIIGGGFPVGGFGGRAKIMELLNSTGQEPGSLFQSGTFSAHPVVMAAGLATLQQLTSDAYAHLDRLGVRLRDGLANLFSSRRIPAQVMGMGSLFGIHMLDGDIRDYRDLARRNTSLAHNIFLSLLDKGFFLSSNLDFNALSLPMQKCHVTELIAAVELTMEQFA